MDGFWGTWSEPVHCPEGKDRRDGYINGFKTRIEKRKNG